LLRDIKVFVEKALSQAVNARVSIGDARGGVFYPVTFSNIVFYSSKDGNRRLLEIDEVSINYRLWDIFFGLKKRSCKTRLISPKFFVASDGKNEIKIRENKDGFFVPYVQLDIVDGSIVFRDTEKFIIKEASGRIVLSKKRVHLQDVNLNFHKLPIKIDGKISNLYSEAPDFDLSVKSESKFAEMTAYAKGPVEKLTVEGDIKTVNGMKVDFAGLCEFRKGALNFKDTVLGSVFKAETGYINFSDRKFKFDLSRQNGDSGKITLSGEFHLPKFSLYGDVKHWDVGGLDLVTSVNLDVEFNEKAKTPTVTGVLDTARTIINYRPYEELSLQFVLKRKALEILGLKWGKSFRLVGKLELEPPYNIELIALLDGTRLEELVSFGGEGLQSVLSGAVKGRLEVEGPLKTCVSRGHISARDGNIGDVYYESAVIHMVGKGPLITIGDSRIYKETGYFLLTGDIDLGKLGKRNVFEDIVVKTDDQIIVWDGWDITKEATDDKVSLRKRINEELEVGFKAPLNEGYALDKEDGEGEVELRYKIQGNESLKMQIKEDEEFLGVEHKVKF